MRDYRPRTNRGAGPYYNSGKEDSTSTNRCTAPNYGRFKTFGIDLTLWIPVIGKGHVWSNEDIIFQLDSIPDLHAGLDGDSVANHHIIFDETMRTDIDILANNGAGQHDDILPDATAGPDVFGLHLRCFMDKDV